MTDDRDLDRLLGLLAEEDRDQPDPAEHPSDGKLSFYHAGQLPPEAAESVREHLVECKRCRDLLLRHAEFVGEEDDAGEGREGVADFGAAADWRLVRERLRIEPVSSLKESERTPVRGGSFLGSTKTAYSIAAMLLLVVGVLSLQLMRGRVQTDLQVVVPTSRTEVRSGGGSLGEQPEEVTLEPGASGIVLQLQAPDEVFREYRVVVRNPDGVVVVRRKLARLDGTFTVSLDRNQLGPGTHEVLLTGIDPERQEMIGRFLIDLRIP